MFMWKVKTWRNSYCLYKTIKYCLKHSEQKQRTHGNIVVRKRNSKPLTTVVNNFQPIFLIFFVSNRFGHEFSRSSCTKTFSGKRQHSPVQKFFAYSREATKTTNTQNNTNLAKYSAATAVQNSIKSIETCSCLHQPFSMVGFKHWYQLKPTNFQSIKTKTETAYQKSSRLRNQ